MTRPRAIVVAGPSGSGKSALFSVYDFGIDAFNVDDRAAELNGGSYRAIAPDTRRRAQDECEAFIQSHLAARRSYAVESTLRSSVAVEQARRARAVGFETVLLFIGTADVEENVARVALRGHSGGHAAEAGEVREIYRRSLANLHAAISVFERIELWDNSRFGAAPVLVARSCRGRWRRLVVPLPPWVPHDARV